MSNASNLDVMVSAKWKETISGSKDVTATEIVEHDNFLRRTFLTTCRSIPAGFGDSIREAELRMYRETMMDPFYGEPKTEDLLYEITGERERRMETMIRPRKVIIEAEDGKNYVGMVERIEASPMKFHGVKVEALLTDQEAGHYGIKRVVFDNPSTIVYWTDGSKTVVTCQDNMQAVKKKVDGKEIIVMKPRAALSYSKEVGLAMCCAKKMFGNKGNYNNIFRKFLGEEAAAEEENG